MLFLFRRNLQPAVTLALCVSWNLGSHEVSISLSSGTSAGTPLSSSIILRSLITEQTISNYFTYCEEKIMIIHIYVLNFKCISGPTICGIKATGSSKCDCSDRFGLQVMKIFWEDFVEWFYMLTHPNSTHHITFLDIKICNLKYLFLKQWLQKRAN